MYFGPTCCHSPRPGSRSVFVAAVGPHHHREALWESIGCGRKGRHGHGRTRPPRWAARHDAETVRSRGRRRCRIASSPRRPTSSATALSSDRGVHAHGCQRGGPEQVDGEPCGLELGIAGVALEDVAEDAADVVAADRLAPRAPSDGLRHEGVAVGDEEGRRSAARGGGFGRAILEWSSRPTISGQVGYEFASQRLTSVDRVDHVVELLVLLDVAGHHRTHRRRSAGRRRGSPAAPRR